ncbi:hypothetical protein BB561_002514 [Smittium simulii]|uniref:Uncharacterized protein n=1 Tax=Smittium simulii TaxID=133385 RepID=A0A2T9YQE2_9FUNG|nr:hypothetical protein BB561_002514 [Smittium simulii]
MLETIKPKRKFSTLECFPVSHNTCKKERLSSASAIPSAAKAFSPLTAQSLEYQEINGLLKQLHFNNKRNSTFAPECCSSSQQPLNITQTQQNYSQNTLLEYSGANKLLYTLHESRTIT